jgi:hypothetical protein
VQKYCLMLSLLKFYIRSVINLSWNIWLTRNKWTLPRCDIHLQNNTVQQCKSGLHLNHFSKMIGRYKILSLVLPPVIKSKVPYTVIEEKCVFQVGSICGKGGSLTAREVSTHPSKWADFYCYVLVVTHLLVYSHLKIPSTYYQRKRHCLSNLRCYV